LYFLHNLIFCIILPAIICFLSEFSKEVNENDWAEAFANARAIRDKKPLQIGESIAIPGYKRVLGLLGFSQDGKKVLGSDPSMPEGQQTIEGDAEEFVRAEDLKFFRRGFNQHIVPVIFPTPTNSLKKMTNDSVKGAQALRNQGLKKR